ncbi:glycoside hydrolase family 71 protein [Fomitiporia mediterranea MF3/22]|uniref:glycoside hydrolase family 71 protein n=1 Tax=Fomitiporia mediterranea (strain MF3/22) TaxID=694068 RepID=UPI0004408BE1|nr:glycoside hydrolase family 71 protein [Fomitiporia mediterranea MF3/22]EJD03163.1 glycoside hydrolase family 71 protein [Fomitiporia mediterranea MF3/22]
MCSLVMINSVEGPALEEAKLEVKTKSPPEKRDSNQKYVFAHHMVGNTAPYTVEDWKQDIQLANASGIDAFALNIGSDSWQSDQVKNAYTAAQQLGSNFKMFLSLDMSILPCVSPENATALRKTATAYADHPAQFKYNNKAFVSTFSGEQCTFGQGNAAQGWSSQFKSQLSNIFFVPNLNIDPTTLGSYSNAIDGEFNWNSAWPIAANNVTFKAAVQKAGAAQDNVVNTQYSQLITQISDVNHGYSSSLDTDQQYIGALKDKLYLAGASPWFFTHYSPSSYNKNWVYLSDLLYPTRWQAIISARNKFPMVEIITWNDYGESSYIGPIKGAQPNSQAWVNGFDHSAFLDMTKYFITAYKTGKYPTVQEDKIYLWARPHKKDATSSDPVGKPRDFDIMEDALFAVVLAKEQSSVTLSTKSITKTVQVKAGLSELSLPLKPGDTMSASLSRNNQVVAQVKPSNFTFQDNANIYNFNAFTAMSGGTATTA